MKKLSASLLLASVFALLLTGCSVSVNDTPSDIRVHAVDHPYDHPIYDDGNEWGHSYGYD